MRSALIASVALLSGCCFAPLQVRDPCQGQLVDHASGEPIANATVDADTVAVSPAELQPGDLVEHESVTTDAQGKWELPSRYHWMAFSPFPAALPGFGTRYRFRAPGYRTKRIDPWAGQTGDEAREVLRADTDKLMKPPPEVMELDRLPPGESDDPSDAR